MMYEIWNKDTYLFNIFPSDGDPYRVLDSMPYGHRLVMVEGGIRRDVTDWA